MRLVVIHSHFRPGGVRRVVELAAPHLVRALRPRIREVVLLGGEAPDDAWLNGFQARLGGVPAACSVEPALGYLSETRAKPAALTQRIRTHLEHHLAGAAPATCLVWAHNLGLGRNLLLARELTRLCARLGLPLVLHHHDWWFDNRWPRWPEMRRAGFSTLAQVARTVFPSEPNIRHAAINQADATLLQRHFSLRTGWLPNPAAPAPAPKPERVRHARGWLIEQLGEAAPVWLMPCRLLRRKNIAEALLLTRWLRPEAWLVTTGGVSSADEMAYANRLRAAAQRHRWRLRLGVLAGDENSKPTVPELMSASEVVLLPSLQEGFGLPALEAAAAQRPLLARALPNVAPDLAQFGFRFPQSYDEMLVDPRLFDESAEAKRQAGLFRRWRDRLPRPCRALAGTPALLAAGGAPHHVPFSRLTLTAQMEVLAQPVEKSWNFCLPLNPFLRFWRERAAQGALHSTLWPRTADRWLGGEAYARQFARLLRERPAASADTQAPVRAQSEFIRAKLAADNLYPLLWARDL